MKKHFFFLLFALVASLGSLFASETQVDGIWYDFNSSSKTAAVTYQGSSSSINSDRYKGEVIIPASVTYLNEEYSVTSIGSGAFYYCTGLTSVTIPNSVTSIGDGAFSGCSGLTSVTIPNSVTGIGDRAFYGCRSLTSVTIPNSVTSIGDYAFFWCNGLTSVTIPNSVTSIGDNAFYDCDGLTSVTIPNSVTSIGEEAFLSCTGLTSVTIGNGVTSIGEKAFSDCTNITSVVWNAKNCSRYDFGKQVESFTFGDEVEVIPASICSGMNNLTSIAIPNSVTSIGREAFLGCTGLTSLTIPNSVTSIESFAFYGCSSLTSVTIPNSVTGIGDRAFYGCSSLTSVTIPNSVTGIGDRAFYGCSNITSVVWNAKNCSSSRDYSYAPFYDTNNITSFVFGNEVESIPSYICYGMRNLSSIAIPNSVTSIGNNAFQYCSSLTSVVWNAKNCSGYNFGSQVESFTFGDEVEVIPASICSGMKKLSSIAIPNSVTCIGGSAFSNCSGLTSVTIPNSVTSIGIEAFSGCSGLTSVTIPNSVTSIGDYAFSNCSGLTSVTIPNSVTSIGGWAFDNCSNLEVVYIDDLAAWIGIKFGNSDANPLYYAHNLRLNNKKLTNLEIPDSVTRLGSYAFSGGSGFTVVTIPESVTSIGDDAFYGCSNLVAVNCNDLTAWCNIEFETASSNPLYYAKNLIVSNKSLTELVVPESINKIGNYTFYNCKKLTSVAMGNSVTSIGDYAFYNCSGLTSVTIPNSVTSIGNDAFQNCSGLTSVTIPNSVTSIGNSAFSSCSGLTSVTIGNSVTSIGNYAFNYCSKLTEVYINGIGSWCNISFGNNEANPLIVSNTSDILYLDSAKITNLVIPEEITNIPAYRFNKCTSIQSVTLPESLENFESNAFNGCSNIQKLTLYAPAPPTGGPNSSIKNTQCALVVPEASFDVYSNSYWWEDFKYIGTIGTSYTVKFLDWDEKELLSTEVTAGDAVNTPDDPTREGYLFTGWDKDLSMVTENMTVTAQYVKTNISVAEALEIGSGLSYGSYSPITYTISGYISAMSGYSYDWNNYGYQTFWITDDSNSLAASNEDGAFYVYRGVPSAEVKVGDMISIETRIQNYGGYRVQSESNKQVTILESTPIIYYVTFVGLNDSVLANVEVKKGQAALAPDVPNVEGYTFSGWSRDFSKVTQDMTIYAQYEINRYSVFFLDWDGSFIAERVVSYGASANPPSSPDREGYRFIGWSQDVTRIADRIFAVAQYEVNQSELIPVYFVDVNGEELLRSYIMDVAPEAPAIIDNPFVGWKAETGDIEHGVIIRASYNDEATPVSNVATTNPAQKLIRENNVYILRGDKTYSITGQVVK